MSTLKYLFNYSFKENHFAFNASCYRFDLYHRDSLNINVNMNLFVTLLYLLKLHSRSSWNFAHTLPGYKIKKEHIVLFIPKELYLTYITNHHGTWHTRYRDINKNI